jgi:SNF2 family DNA or RNA helicase
MGAPANHFKSHKSPKRESTPELSDKKADDVDRDCVTASTLKIWSRGNDDMVPSTKMLEMVRLLQEWELTGDKVIVYSQCEQNLVFSPFGLVLLTVMLGTSMLDLIEIVFSRHGIQSTRFDGTMSKASRDQVLAQFKRPGRPNVILIRYASL